MSRFCQNATENCFASFLVIASQCQALYAFVESSKLHLRSVMSLAHLSACNAARETQIEFAFFFVSQVSRCQTPPAFQCQTLSAFVHSARMHLRSVLPLAHLSAFSAAREMQIDLAFYFLTEVSQNVSPSAFPDSAKMQLKTALPLS